MKKGILLLIAFLGFGALVQAQTVSKKEAKKVIVEINTNIDKLEKQLRRRTGKKFKK